MAVKFDVAEKPQWCPGCGDFSILMGMKNALSELGLNPKDIVIVSGIGCSSKIPHYIYSYGYEGIHGRPLPLASGIKLANHNLKVIAMGGDGDGYAEGAQHFIHIMRRNYDLTYVVHDNEIYGLTTGQYSPTSMKGLKTKTSVFGSIETQFNPIANAIVNGATFVARTFAGDLKHMTEIFKQAVSHKGFSFVDVFQPCVTFNKFNTYQWFQQRVYKLEETGYKPDNKMKALEKSFEDSATNYEKVPIGIFFRELRPTYEDQLPQLKDKPLVKQELKPDISKLCEEFL